jgi:hypothetical protein
VQMLKLLRKSTACLGWNMNIRKDTLFEFCVCGPGRLGEEEENWVENKCLKNV